MFPQNRLPQFVISSFWLNKEVKMSNSVFHQGQGDNQTQLWYSAFDGTNWTTPDTQVPNVYLSDSPSAVVVPDGGIAVFHQGFGGNVYFGDGTLWYTYSPDGTNWGEDTQVPNVGMSESPSAVVY